jgi:hypothetical protein
MNEEHVHGKDEKKLKNLLEAKLNKGNFIKYQHNKISKKKNQ